MAGREDTVGVIADAEQLIDAGEFPTALWRLRLAAGNVRADDANAGWVLERIRGGAAAIAWKDPRYENDAQAVWDIVLKREAELGLTAETPRPVMPRRPAGVVPSKPWDEEEPWYFVAAEAVASIAIIASLICIVGGLVLGIKASRYSGYDGTQHSGGIFIVYLLSGTLAAVLWIGVAAALKLLVHTARAQRTAAAA